MLPDTKLTSKSLIGYLWSHWRLFWPGMCYAVGRILAIASFPLIFKYMIDQQLPAGNVRGILMLGGVVVLLLCVHQFLSVNGAIHYGQAVSQMIMHLRAQIFDKIQFLNFTYLDRQKTGRLLAKYAFDTQKIDGVTMPILNNVIPNTLYSAIILSILVTMNWQLAVVILLMVPLIGVMRFYFFKRMKARQRENRLAQEVLTGTATEYLSALRLVRSYGEEEQAQEEMNETNEKAADSRVALVRVSSNFNAFAWGSVQFLTMVVVAGAALLEIYHQIGHGTVVAFLVGLPALVQPIGIFANLSDQYFLGSEAYASIKELLDEPEIEQWKGTRTIEPIRGQIDFDHVSFSYPLAERNALDEFTLNIAPGERIALVGASGAGKSTVANLVLGLYATKSGQIRVDGVPQAELDMRWFRQKTAVVLQESVLLSGSIADNIRFAKEEAADDEIREAARRANAVEFIEQMPEGFNSVVGERGVMLSGGQKQRIAIARALLRDPAILILDEPTSALDYASERLIQQALDELARGRTVITIAHRLSTIRNADRVIVLDQGRIVEQGTFGELMNQRGHFHRMLASQRQAADETGELILEDAAYGVSQ